jgi:arylformamidase
MTRLYDISRTISTKTAIWPGDAPFTFRHVVRRADGAAYNLTHVAMSPHTGTHADAPWHFEEAGAHPAEVPLAPYFGRAHVVTVTRDLGGIVPADLGGRDLAGVERLLLHTRASEREDDAWSNDFPHPTPALVDWIADLGAVLLGVDMPSVDAFDSADLACHHRLAARGVATLENLRFVGVPDGVYDLAALPLKFSETCGSPVRAVLRAP